MIRKCLALILILSVSGILSGQEIPAPASFHDVMISYEPLREESSISQWMSVNESLTPGFTPVEMASWTERMEEDLVAWAVDMLQKSIEKSDLTGLSGALEEQDRLWLYQTQDGVIRFDSSGDPLIRSTDPSDIASDKAMWLQAMQKTGDEVVDHWKLKADFTLEGIVNRIPTDFRAKVEEELHVSLNQYQNRGGRNPTDL